MKIFLFGKDGMLGRYMHLYLKQYYDIVAFNRNDFDVLKNDRIFLEKLLEKNNIDSNCVIINSIGLIPQRKDNNIENYILINSYFPKMLEQMSEKYSCKYIQISTNCVFSEKNPLSNESNFPDPSDIYGLSKYLGETSKSTIIRTSIIGEELNTSISLLSWVLKNNSKTIDGYTNHYWNGVTCLELSKYIKTVIEKNLFWIGVRHVHSEDIVSKYDLIKEIIQIYNLDIVVNKIEYAESNYRTLSSNFNHIYKIPALYKQICEQKGFILDNI
jgi:dTDP-4-dehydrorhamnose reductase